MVFERSFGRHRVTVQRGGYCAFDVQPTNSRHRHDYHEVCLVLSGQGRYWHAGRAWALSPGDVFLAEPGAVHEISSFTTRDLRLYFVSASIQPIDAGRASAEDRLLERFTKAHEIVRPASASLRAYTELVAGEPGSELERQTRVQALGAFFFEMIEALIGEPEPVPAQPPAGPEVRQAIEFIEANLDRRVSVVEIAGYLGLSERTLRRRFREAGIALSDEIQTRRMRRAAHQLLMGFAVGEVAAWAGFSDPSHFTKVFRKELGVTPKRFQTSYSPGRATMRTLPADPI